MGSAGGATGPDPIPGVDSYPNGWGLPAPNRDDSAGIQSLDDATSPLPVNDTVLRAQQGDHAAFRQLYEANAGRVLALCLRLAGDRHEAEEHTQDVFVRAWERLGSFRGESAFSTWLHRLAVNEVLQSRRTAARRNARVTLSDDEQLGEGVTLPAGTSPDLTQAIAALPDQARAVFVLFEIEGYQHEEIGRVMGIAEGTSKAQLFRARRLLRKALDR